MHIGDQVRVWSLCHHAVSTGLTDGVCHQLFCIRLVRAKDVPTPGAFENHNVRVPSSYCLGNKVLDQIHVR